MVNHGLSNCDESASSWLDVSILSWCIVLACLLWGGDLRFVLLVFDTVLAGLRGLFFSFLFFWLALGPTVLPLLKSKRPVSNLKVTR